MINARQTDECWNDRLAAEVRSLYFAELGTRYTMWKQIISGVSLLLASGTAVTLVAHLPAWIPTVLSVLTAVPMAYSIAVNLDQKAVSMAGLHHTWSQIASDRRRLWEHWFDEDAKSRLREIEVREHNASQTAIIDTPYDKILLKKMAKFCVRPTTKRAG